jgi:hypothetical protein
LGQGTEKLINMPTALGDLAVFHRYERRALSRRKFVIRAPANAFSISLRVSGSASRSSKACILRLALRLLGEPPDLCRFRLRRFGAHFDGIKDMPRLGLS